jgi:hypothetical protein
MNLSLLRIKVRIWTNKGPNYFSEKFQLYGVGVKITELQKQEYKSFGHHLGTNLIFPKKAHFESVFV